MPPGIEIGIEAITRTDLCNDAYESENCISYTTYRCLILNIIEL